MNLKKLKVLVVDDDKSFLGVIKKTLEYKNCEVTCVTDMDEGLSYLINQVYHVVFIDCILRNQNGMLFQTMVRDILGKSVQIIMMSGIVSSKSVSNYIDLGFFDFLLKPISYLEIDMNLRKIKEKYVYGENINFLIKFFKENVSKIDHLKYLVSLEKVYGHEFFFYLSAILSSKESLKLTLKFNNKVQDIFFNQGNFVDYRCNDSQLLIDRLLSKGLIQSKTRFQLQNKTEEECIDYLTSSFLLGPEEILDFKYNLLIETLKSIYPSSEISVKLQMVPILKKSYLILTQNEYADIVFLFFKQKFNNQFFSLFDEAFFDRYFIFNEKIKKSYLPEVIPFVKDLKSKMKIQSLYEKHNKNKNLFCFYTLYVLLKGDVLISEGKNVLNEQYIYERYEKLLKFFSQKENRKKLFHMLIGENNKDLNIQDKQKAYKNFLKHNHPDIIGNHLSKRVVNQINLTLGVFKEIYEEEVNPKVKKQIEEKQKQSVLKDSLLLNEKQIAIERYLEQENYDKAFSILKTIPKSKIDDKNFYLQMLIIWFYFKTDRNVNDIDKKVIIYWMSCLQKNKNDLENNKLYYYIVGLNYFSREYHQKALEAFQFCQKLDLSFKATYKEIKKCQLLLIKKPKSFMSRIAKLKKKKKKAS
ncbi:MAG: response regulator [Bdellovibrionales bacterium]|nr:response regulator [Bdellovibrionales bacterium]